MERKRDTEPTRLTYQQLLHLESCWYDIDDCEICLRLADPDATTVPESETTNQP